MLPVKMLFLENLNTVLAVDAIHMFKERIDGAWPESIPENLTPEFIQRIHAFVANLDSSDLRNAQLPLRLKRYYHKGKMISGDPGIQIETAKVLLYTLFSDKYKLYTELKSCCIDTGYFFALLQASMALDLSFHEECEKSLREAMAIQTDCVLTSRINTALVAASSGKYGIKAAGRNLSERICLHPFNTVLTNSVESLSEYGMRLCECPSTLPYDLDIDNAWNGRTAQEIRRSILDGDFSYCTRTSCYLIMQNALPKKAEIKDTYIKSIIDGHMTCLPRSPYNIILAHDTTCNLACPSCRPRPRHANSMQRAAHDAFVASQVIPLMGDNLHWLRLGYTGEAFASPHIMSFIRSLDYERFDKLNFFAITNGTLLDQNAWDALTIGGGATG